VPAAIQVPFHFLSLAGRQNLIYQIHPLLRCKVFHCPLSTRWSGSYAAPATGGAKSRLLNKGHLGSERYRVAKINLKGSTSMRERRHAGWLIDCSFSDFSDKHERGPEVWMGIFPP